jgi:hypothetical protein
MMRLIALGAAAACAALLAAACTTTEGGDGPRCASGDVADRLGAIQTRLLEAQGRPDFDARLAASYAELGALSAEAGAMNFNEPQDQIACMVVSAQASTLMGLLPPSARPTDPESGSPMMAAQSTADDAVRYCNNLVDANQPIEDARRCAVAQLLEGAAASQEASVLIRDQALAPALPTDDEWTALSGLAAEFAATTERWPGVRRDIAALPGSSDAMASRLVDSYLPWIACSTYQDGATLLRRRPPGAPASAAVDAFSQAARAANAQAAAGLGLPLDDASTQACSAASSGACETARLAALANQCATLWSGAAGGGS